MKFFSSSPKGGNHLREGNYAILVLRAIIFKSLKYFLKRGRLFEGRLSFKEIHEAVIFLFCVIFRMPFTHRKKS